MAKQTKATAAETGNRKEGESLRRKLIQPLDLPLSSQKLIQKLILTLTKCLAATVPLGAEIIRWWQPSKRP